MEYRNLGRAGVKVSSLCLGAMTFGEADDKSFMHQVGADEASSHAILDAALDAGINFVDTANVYGQDGLSERVLGRWLTQPGKRDRVVLATKFRFRMWDGPTGTGASAYHIRRAAEDSLRRLQTDRIDLYQIHMQDIDTPEEETLRALDDLVRQGKVLHIGCSNYAAYRLVESTWISKTQGLAGYATQQMQYSLLTRDIEREHVPVARDHGIGILPWSPLAAGFLSGKYSRGSAAPGGTRLSKWTDRMASLDTERNWQILDAVRAVADETGATCSQVALAWVLGRPGVSSVIIGARTLAHLTDNLGAVDLKLTAEQLGRLETASRPPAGYPYAFIANIQKRW